MTMITFSEFDFSWSYSFASSTRDRIFDKEESVYIADYFQVDSAFEHKAIKPRKETFLHQLIQYFVYDDVEYAMRKGDTIPFAENEISRLLNSYNIPFPKNPAEFDLPVDEQSEDREYLWAYHLLSLYESNLVRPITNEVFTLLFADREALREFNELIASVVKPLKASNHPTLLKADGKVRRCSYWPTWLKKALFYRDKGHCSLCLTDLSGLFSAGAEIHIDHIVPLNLGGTNDPTNLQILCKDCNSTKSGNASQVSRFQHVYWDAI